MKFLITGGCGFIGTNFVKRLVSDGAHMIRIVDNLSVGKREDLSLVCQFKERNISYLDEPQDPYEDSSVELMVGNILDDKLALKAAKEMDIIIHLAANTGVRPSVENPRLDCMTNILGTFNYLEAARQNNVNRFVLASSGAPIGECEPPIHEELAPHPVSPYGASKLAGEAYCSAYFCTFGIETVALRFGNVYGVGSGRKNSVVAKFIQQAMRGEKLEIYGNGKQTRDFIYIDDLVRAIYLASTVDGIGGEVFQIATNTETKVSELINTLLSLLAEVGINDVQVSNTAPLSGEVKRNFSDITKAKQILGWQPEVKLATGLQYTVKWFNTLYPLISNF